MSDERLARARLLEECEASIRELQNQNAELLAKHTLLQSEMLKLTQELMAIRLEPKSPKSAYEKPKTSVSRSLSTTANSGISSGPPSLVDSGSEHSSDSIWTNLYTHAGEPEQLTCILQDSRY